MSKTAKINTSRGKLRFQISSRYTKNYYPEYNSNNKYIYLGIEDNPRNRNKAEAKLLDLIEDLESGRFNPYAEEKYHIKDLVQGIKKKTLPSLEKLCSDHLNWRLKHGFIVESTAAGQAKHLKEICKFPQDLLKGRRYQLKRRFYKLHSINTFFIIITFTRIYSY